MATENAFSSYNLTPFYEGSHNNILQKPLYIQSCDQSKATISYTNITFLCCRSSTICTYGRTKMAVILIALFSLVYNIPRFFEVTWDTPTPIMVKKRFIIVTYNIYMILALTKLAIN